MVNIALPDVDIHLDMLLKVVIPASEVALAKRNLNTGCTNWNHFLSFAVNSILERTVSHIVELHVFVILCLVIVYTANYTKSL